MRPQIEGPQDKGEELLVREVRVDRLGKLYHSHSVFVLSSAFFSLLSRLLHCFQTCKLK